MYAKAFANAWKQLGHEVNNINTDSYCFHKSNYIFNVLNKIQDRYHYGFFLHKLNRELIKSVDTFKPDFVFLYRCCNIYGKTVEIIAKKTKVFSYNNDDPFSGIPSNKYFRHYIKDAHFCHINYVYRKKNIFDFRKIGVLNTKVLLPYFQKSSNFPIDCEKTISIAFMGHFENDGRDEYILKLKEAGIPVVVYGDHRWLNAPNYEKIKDVVFPAKRGKEYNETINLCKVCLVFLSKLNHDTYTRRCFEIPASKGVMLCEYTEDMDKLFPEGHSALYFRSPKEMIEKAKFLINDEMERQRIASNSFSRVQELGGSEYDRCQQIIDDYISLCSNKT